MPRRIVSALKIAATVLLVWYVVHAYLDPREFMRIVRDTHPALLCAVLLLHLGSRYVAALQTRACIAGYGINTATGRVFKVQLIASFYSLFLPGEIAGGGVTWYLLARDSGQGMTVGGALVYLRLLNLVTLFPFGVLGVLSEPVLISMGIGEYLLWTALILALLLLPFTSKRAALFLEAICMPMVNRLRSGALQRAAAELIGALRTGADMPPGIFLALIFSSLAGHVLNMMMLWVGGLAVGLQLPVAAYSWLLPVVVLVHMAPITVGGLGLREISLVFLLERIYGADSQLALALSAIIFFVTVLFSGVIGGYLVYRSVGRAGRDHESALEGDESARRLE